MHDIDHTGEEEGADPAPPEHPLSDAAQRKNFWVCGSEAALYITAMKIMGPMTLIPFLFKRLDIDNAWLGLFTLAMLIMAFGTPLGTALAGGRRWKLPYCLKLGVLQRVPYFIVPIGAMFFFDSPALYLMLLVSAWMINGFFMGMAQPVYQVLIANGIRESWWGRMMALRNILGAATGLLASGFVWWVNQNYEAPHNYIILGWLGMVLLFLSLYIVSKIREVPMQREFPHGLQHLNDTLRQMRGILQTDKRVRWIILGRVFRTCGFLLGTYMTPAFIERCHLTDAQMWLPIILLTGAEIISHTLSGWFVDQVGAKPALVLSSLIVAVNAGIATFASSFTAFMIIFTLAAMGGSLLMNAWPTLLLKLAPIESRPAYASTISIAAAPGAIAINLLGMYIVMRSGFDYVFLIASAGALIAALVFLTKMPNIRYAPEE